MATWTVSTKEKKSVEEHEMWEKDGQVIVRISGFRWGTAWLYDGDHNWEIEDDHVRITGPVKIDLVDSDGYGDSAIIKENVQPEE